MRSIVVLSLLVAMCAATVSLGCGSSTSPSTTHAAAGSWSGTLNDQSAGAGTLRVALTHNASLQRLDGTWSVTLAQTVVQGTLTGSSETNPLALVLTCSGTTGFGGMTFTAAGTRLTGTFTTNGCVPMTTGTIDLTKQ